MGSYILSNKGRICRFQQLIRRLGENRTAELCAEFKQTGIGIHSPDLQAVLRLMRTQPLTEKYILVAIEPHKRWMLAQLTGKPEQPIDYIRDRVYTNLNTAEWDVFKLRWFQLTGNEAPTI